MKGEFAGAHDFEVVAFLIVLPNTTDGASALNVPTGTEAADA